MSYKVPATQHGFKQSGRMLLITFEVSELTNPDVARIALHGEQYGWLFFNEDRESEENVSLPKLPRSGRKTQAERMRAVLYLLWEQSDRKLNSDDYYSQEMDRMIEELKAKL
jgi:hypothetical protein